MAFFFSYREVHRRRSWSDNKSWECEEPRFSLSFKEIYEIREKPTRQVVERVILEDTHTLDHLDQLYDKLSKSKIFAGYIANDYIEQIFRHVESAKDFCRITLGEDYNKFCRTRTGFGIVGDNVELVIFKPDFADLTYEDIKHHERLIESNNKEALLPILKRLILNYPEVRKSVIINGILFDNDNFGLELSSMPLSDAIY